MVRAAVIFGMIMLFLTVAQAAPSSDIVSESRQATGVRVGEVTPTSAIIWTRLTAHYRRKTDEILFKDFNRNLAKPLPSGVDIDMLEGACPGAPGKVRISYGTRKDLSNAVKTPWAKVSEEADFTRQFKLAGLLPDRVYYFATETEGADGTRHESLCGHFRTAPEQMVWKDILFTVVTGMGYAHTDHKDGFSTFQAMASLKPSFCVFTGDTVYYDADMPLANTVALARYHWHRMLSLPFQKRFLLQIPAYFQKDDHDTLSNNCWPSLNPSFMLPMTFRDGQRVFLEQVPMGEKTYRTFRWGKGLQIWLVEGRDYRSSNMQSDGPHKSIWGEAQKVWLKQTLLASDADWKLLISPTPIVGPDRLYTNDNHANEVFSHEGNEFRTWLKEHLADKFFIICGDRHWQYHSVHPDLGIHEFSCGPVSDEHATKGPRMQNWNRFHRVKGGFLSVLVTPGRDRYAIMFRFHDTRGSVLYQFKKISK